MPERLLWASHPCRSSYGGFPNTDVSVLMPDTRSTRDFAHEKETKAPEGTAVGGRYRRSGRRRPTANSRPEAGCGADAMPPGRLRSLGVGRARAPSPCGDRAVAESLPWRLDVRATSELRDVETLQPLASRRHTRGPSRSQAIYCFASLASQALEHLNPQNR
jgi:hypothetical protein